MARRIRTAVEHWPLAAPFVIARGTTTIAHVVTVGIEEDGLIGRGESVPVRRYGETVESVPSQIAAIEAALAGGATRGELQTLLPPGAARNAADCALWDLEAKRSGRSVTELIGAPPLEPIVTAITVGIDTPERMAEAATTLARAPLIKVKVNADQVPERLRAVRAAAPEAALIVDPNESWDMALLERLQPLLAELGIAFVEQPLPADADSILKGFAPLVPVCADESCHTAADLARLEGLYGMVNIKLDKAGGLTEALVLLEAARSRGFDILVGCMISTSLSIVPALHVAMAADYADLDGPLWLKQDRPGGVTGEHGRLLPPAPGFWG